MKCLPHAFALRVSSRWAGCTFALAAAAGCTTETSPSLALRFRFENAATAARADHVSVSIVRGESCAGDDVVYQADVGRAGEVATPPRLEAGAYRIVGEAASSDCQSIAYACAVITLPAASSPEIVLADVAPRPVCSGACASQCESDGESDGTADGSAAQDGASDGSGGLPDAGGGSDGTTGMVDGGVDGGAPDAGPGDPCTDGTKRAGGSCYLFVDAPTLAWADAENACVAWGGHLVTINDAEEELWLYQTTRDNALDGVRYWIGFTDSAIETLWTWADGSSAGREPAMVVYDLDVQAALRFKMVFDDQYTHWGPNVATAGNSEPNNGNAGDPTGVPGEDCADVNPSRISSPGVTTPRAEWDDQDCTRLKSYVCER